jgi:hypothetical protein
MKKIHLPGLPRNFSRWGPLLLAAGLLLVFVQGLLHVHEVQDFFFPYNYQALELTLIKKEHDKIGQGLTALQDQLMVLTMVQQARGKPDPVSSSQPLSATSSPFPAADACGPLDSAWQAEIMAAKKKRAHMTRKLNHIRLILQSLQRNLEAQSSGIGSRSSAKKAKREKILQQIRESRALSQAYNGNLRELSIKLNKIAECSSNQQVSTIPQDEMR